MDYLEIAKEIRNDLLNESGHALPCLNGFCAIFTARFCKRVKKAEWCYNDQHCFPVVDGIVYDGTARQFSSTYPNVLVKKLEKLGEEWKVQNRGKTVQSLVKHLQKNEWEEAQIPLTNGNMRKITKKDGPFAGWCL